MVFAIELNEPKSAYVAGDVIKGNVVLESGKDEAIGKVAIMLYGRSKTNIHIREGNVNKHYTSFCTLFSYTQDLYVGKYTFKRGSHSWPFEFKFPAQTVPSGENYKFDSADGKWPEPTVPHALPPSFTTTVTGYLCSTDCAVEYKLEAELTRPPDVPLTKKFSSMGSTVDLTHVRFRPEESPDPFLKTTEETFTVKSLRLLSERKQGLSSMKNMLRSTFKSSDLPSASFTVELACPMQIYPGGPFPISLALKEIQTSEDVPASPAVAIKELTVTILSVVSCRGIRGGVKQFLFSVDTVVIDTFGEIHVQLPQPTGSKADAGAAPRGVDLKQLGKTAFSSQKIECDFQTYNTILTHQLEVKAKLSCADKSFKLKARTHLRVLSPVYRPVAVPWPAIAQPNSSQATPANMINRAVNPDAMELPVYEPPPPRYELGDGNQVPELATGSIPELA